MLRNASKQVLSFWTIVALVLALYAGAFFIRAWSAFDYQVHPDEIHWQSRSYTVVKKIQTGHLSHFSDHLGHPGVPPALLMAFFEFAGDSLNRFRDIKFGNSSYWDHLGSARFGSIAVSSAVVPIVFLLLYPVGLIAALLASVMLALDPQHIALSRMAHLDAMLTMFVCAALFFFFRSEMVVKRWMYVCLAGLCWGFAITTKPTAAALVGGFLAYRVVMFGISKARSESDRVGVLLFRDIWAVIIGMSVLCVLCTRFWVHPSQYITRLHINSALADAIYVNGTWLKSLSIVHWIVPCLAIIMCFWAIILNTRRVSAQSSNWSYAIVSTGACLSVCLLAFVSFPQIIENLVRFWIWVIGLSGESHKVYGETVEPLPYGYLRIFLTRLSPFVLLGVFLQLMFSVFWKGSEDDKKVDYERRLLVLLLTVCCLWVLPLSVSSKQTVRYVVPIWPFLYAIAALGFVNCIGVISRIFGADAKTRYNASVVVAIVLVIVQAFTLQFWSPHVGLYHNSLFGGLAYAVESGEELPFVGTTEVLNFLHSEARKPDVNVRLRVIGDVNAFKYTRRRAYAGEKRLLSFPTDRGPIGGHYIVDFPSFQKRSPNRLRDEIKEYGAKKVFSFSFKEQELAVVYKADLCDFEDAEFFEAKRFKIHTGVLQSQSDSFLSYVRVERDRDKKGHLVSGISLSVARGIYEIRPQFRLSANAVDPSKLAVRFGISSVCERLIKTSELTTTDFRAISFTCEVPNPRIIQLNGYWFGTNSVDFSGVEIQKLEPIPQKLSHQ